MNIAALVLSNLLAVSALAQSESGIQPILLEALASMKAGDFQAALESYQEAIDTDPGDWRGYQGAGNACSKLENWPCALENYEDALRLKEGGDTKLQARVAELKALVLPTKLEPEDERPSPPLGVISETGAAPLIHPPRGRQNPDFEGGRRTFASIRAGSFLRLSREFQTCAETAVARDKERGYFTPGSTAEYEVSTARTGFALSADLGFQRSATLVLGLRAGMQWLPEAFLDHFSMEYGSLRTTYNDILGMKVVHGGPFLQIQKSNPRLRIYGQLSPGLYYAQVSEDQTLHQEDFSLGLSDTLTFTGDVSGVGFGVALQSGFEIRVGKILSFIVEASLETANIGSLKGRYEVTDTSSSGESGEAVWAVYSNSGGDMYTIQPTDTLGGGRKARLGLTSLRLDLGIRGGW